MAEKLITPPAIEPVTLSEAKSQCIVETSAYDDLISSKIVTARHWVEGYLGRALVAQTWRTKLDRFPCGVIRLHHPPLQSVTSITYIDTSGASQTLSSAAYIVDTDSEPGRIAEAYGYTWPDTQDRINAVTITSVHGYDDTGDSPYSLAMIPQDIKDAILVLVTDLYQNRELNIVGPSVSVNSAVESLLWRHRVMPMTH